MPSFAEAPGDLRNCGMTFYGGVPPEMVAVPEAASQSFVAKRNLVWMDQGYAKIYAPSSGYVILRSVCPMLLGLTHETAHNASAGAYSVTVQPFTDDTCIELPHVDNAGGVLTAQASADSNVGRIATIGYDSATRQYFVYTDSSYPLVLPNSTAALYDDYVLQIVGVSRRYPVGTPGGHYWVRFLPYMRVAVGTGDAVRPFLQKALR